MMHGHTYIKLKLVSADVETSIALILQSLISLHKNLPNIIARTS